MLARLMAQSLESYLGISAETRLIVAVSGGADSLALLHLLTEQGGKLGLEMIVAHYNHHLRLSAQRDADHVAHVAQVWGLPCIVGHGHVEALAAAWNLGIEAAARRARYTFLAQVAQEKQAQTVVTAHHADDQAETVLLQALRGTSAGLGLRPVSPLPHAPHLRLWRPLLKASKDQLLEYCQRYEIAYMQDESNDDIRFMRNYLRRSIAPLLAHINSSWVAALGRFAEAQATDADFIAQCYAEQVAPHEQHGHNYRRLPKALYRQIHQALAIRWIRASAQALGQTEDLGQERLLAAHRLASIGETGKRAQLPHGLELHVERSTIAVIRLED
ncbi:MAG: tRNA lysidine(34) synthetase TilS [Anaerolineae bacterium]|nr:tRNA lysidine(34) synthetase TilS [Anaerolineae bacterium]MDW8171523.1 tRNA lysidine(34) synthetase TilS [Anaerolineae bacterium]